MTVLTAPKTVTALRLPSAAPKAVNAAATMIWRPRQPLMVLENVLYAFFCLISLSTGCMSVTDISGAHGSSMSYLRLRLFWRRRTNSSVYSHIRCRSYRCGHDWSLITAESARSFVGSVCGDCDICIRTIKYSCAACNSLPTSSRNSCSLSLTSIWYSSAGFVAIVDLVAL